jgi:hypothetical protein
LKEPKRQRCRYLERKDPELRTMPDDYSETPDQRMGRLRRLAAKARESAAKSSTAQSRDEFLRIADSWDNMADAVMSDEEEQRR